MSKSGHEEDGHKSEHEEDRHTLGVVLRGDSKSLDKVLRLLRTLRGVSVVFARKTRQRLWVIDHDRMTGRRRCRHAGRHANRQVRGRDGRVVIGDEIYSAAYVQKVEDDWCKEGLIR